MKTKFLFLFLTFALNSNAQDTVTVQNSAICQAFWQIFDNETLLLKFENSDSEKLDFQSIISYVDTLVNDISENENFDFQSDGYIIQKHRFSCKDISKIVFIYQQKRIEKMGFYIENYDSQGNLISENLLFWAIL